MEKKMSKFMIIYLCLICFAYAQLPSTAYAENLGHRIYSETRIEQGDYLQSQNKLFSAIMQSDGNFVVYLGSDGDHDVPLWDTKTDRTTKNVRYFAKLQSENFVVYKGKKAVESNALWSIGGRSRKDYELNMQNDGNLVMYDPNKNAVWASNTHKKVVVKRVEEVKYGDAEFGEPEHVDAVYMPVVNNTDNDQTPLH